LRRPSAAPCGGSQSVNLFMGGGDVAEQERLIETGGKARVVIIHDRAALQQDAIPVILGQVKPEARGL
jgi:hypothetical protein